MRLGAACRQRPLVLVLISIAVLLAPTLARAQAFVEVKGKEPIPREGFKTWSLFLVTNQDWLVSESALRLQQLYERSMAFGRVIGKEHAAVWFWKADMSLGSHALADNVDVERAVAYCRILGRDPDKGPYLVFTTTYPDEHAAPAAYQIISLDGRKADDIGGLLIELGRQLRNEGVVRLAETLPQPQESDDFWSAWFDATRHALANLKSVVCFAIRTPTLIIEAGCKPGGVS